MTWPRAINPFEGESLWMQGVEPALRPASLADAYEECRQIMRYHAHAFSFAAHFVPFPKRQAIWAIYALLRHSDDLVDRAPATATRADLLAAISHWEAQVRAETSASPLICAFTDTRARFAVPLEPLWDLFEGMRMDLTRSRYATWAELERYCYCVAGTVGLLCTPVLGYDGDAETLHYAAMLGTAMQLTNILRDVGEDVSLGRIYLPSEELEAFGYSEEKALAGVVDSQFRALMRFQIARARDLYRESMPAIARLDRTCHLPIQTAATLYGGILGRIEANDYQVYTRRAHLTTRDKVLHLPHIWWQTRRLTPISLA